MVYTRPVHSDPFADSSATDATTIIDALSDGLEAVETGKAALASPTFTGTPAAPTAAAATNTTQLATTAFVTTADNLKANLASPTFTGTVTIPTPATSSNTTVAASTAMVHANTVVTHPNTDDKLVQVWDTTTSALTTVFYDSGWRTLTSWDTSAVVTGLSLGSNWVPYTATAGYIMCRRVNFQLHVQILGLQVTSTTASTMITIPTAGFYPSGSTPGCGAILGSSGGGTWALNLTSGGVLTRAGNTTFVLNSLWATGASFGVFDLVSAVIPASLPGTLYSAAP